jgi:hypothetical protein
VKGCKRVSSYLLNSHELPPNCDALPPGEPHARRRLRGACLHDRQVGWAYCPEAGPSCGDLLAAMPAVEHHRQMRLCRGL